jgi:hypothetical protein
MKILITGLPVSGKSTLRRRLVGLTSALEVPFFQCDVDGFPALRDTRDAINCVRIHDLVKLEGKELLLVEDVNPGLYRTGISLSDYALIVYVVPGLFAYWLFLLSRGWQWFLLGRYAWTLKSGWHGTGRVRDWRNILPILKVIGRAVWLRSLWIDLDKKQLSGFTGQVIFLRSSWTRRGPVFRI